jgi:cytochrome oxidase assembly protein ShyY1
MAVVALVCIAAGSWQVARFEQKVHENDDLRANAHRSAVPVGQLLPLVGSAASPSQGEVEFRAVRATGIYDGAAQALVRNRTQDGENGFLLVTPFRTADAVLLVVRGFVAQLRSGDAPTPPAPPSGSVTILARAQRAETRADQAAQLPPGQVESINPRDQAARLGAPVYNGYVQLEAHQPGTSGVQALPAPDLSNPAGGALEPQHFAYVIQWYLFAALAVAAPFVMARAELRQRRGEQRDYDQEPTSVDFPTEPAAEASGELSGEVSDDPCAGPSADSAQPAVESTPSLTEAERRAAKLADRYGHAR